MPRSAPSLLSRLRRHRGLWVLAVAVLLIKLAAGTICLTDGPRKGVAAQATTTMAATAFSTASVDAVADNAGDCLLGEGGDCHCACAHTMPMPATAPPPIARMDAHFDSPAIHSGFALATIGSLLRPPIA